MTNFIIGMLVGMLTVGIIIIIVDQMRGRGYSTNPVEILGGVILWCMDAVNRSAKKFAAWSVKRKEDPYAKDEYINETRIEAEDSILEIDEDLAMDILEDEDMAFIDLAVAHCEGKVI